MTRLLVGTFAVTAAVLTGTVSPAAAATETDTVRPDRVGADWHLGDTRPSGTATFSDAYGGGGSTSSAVVLSTPESGAKVQMLSDDWAGTPIADITALSYETYLAESPPNGVALPALNLRVDLSGDGLPDYYLVFEPYQAYGNEAIQSGTWQEWDALKGGDAVWWLSGHPTCGQAHDCTWDEIVALHPAATVQEGANFRGSLGFNQGSGNGGVVAAADLLRVATADRDVTYDFETDVVLSSKDQCKDGGWATSTAPVYRNQGDCVSSFASQGKSRR
ncbi:hypothetical protein [Candidatus Blastococcus massiliensis]|uniref:hypothetical protein n=1 Tax=Candidatus Blastococcus massiliensis TaxID=1470358 RepID=UPI0012DE6908|nr:hypothetical protein [Candidatus Blastococcus massiliensis]